MKARYSLVLVSIGLLLFTACQEEDVTQTYEKNSKTLLQLPKYPSTIKLRSPSQYVQANDFVRYFYPRLPRPIPCPVLSGCQLPHPELLVSVPEGVVLRINARYYTGSGELYAASDEKMGGKVEYSGSEALASLRVVNEEVETDQLQLLLQLVYEVNGRTYSDEFYNEQIPVQIDEYRQAKGVMYRYPRFPRPIPCPELSGCQDPNPELHVIVPDGRVRSLDARLITENGELYACSSRRCAGELLTEGSEALAELTVVNPDIEAKNLILVTRVYYEIEGEIISEVIYDRDVPIYPE